MLSAELILILLSFVGNAVCIIVVTNANNESIVFSPTPVYEYVVNFDFGQINGVLLDCRQLDYCKVIPNTNGLPKKILVYY